MNSIISQSTDKSAVIVQNALKQRKTRISAILNIYPISLKISRSCFLSSPELSVTLIWTGTYLSRSNGVWAFMPGFSVSHAAQVNFCKAGSELQIGLNMYKRNSETY